MKQSSLIGIDIGGTNIKIGQFLENGVCVNSSTIVTPKPATPEAIVKTTTQTVKALIKDYNCIALGVGIPGPVDHTNRISKVAINLSNWENVPLARLLEESTQLPTTIANDADCAGLGEAWLGAGRYYKNLIMLTLGTGVGGAIILNGQLFTGHLGTAGELGLITLDFNGPICKSGNRGSLEQFGSIQAIHRMTGMDPAELSRLAKEGNQEAIAFWEKYGQLLGIGLANLIYILTPEVIVIGGGISNSISFFLGATLREIEQRVLPTSRTNLKLLEATLGDKAGMLGAARLASNMANNINNKFY
ncbi:ROK family protein [Candidatus Atelocyanobacterium thalassae]|uniref:Glucokinase n=1 Tax=cyanobacterium endosymbiont of Braarudosphaera bigelowii TaxID=1285375 RepID=A0ABN6JZI7_9CHRO|nr:ROK family protein [Candidatus Atelocyanobacterium thalassa]BDA39654.1 glucokinase [cyanobacterium endosymbiont of Braarudosphaera bigelowii]